MSKSTHQTFETPDHLHTWLQANHASETELWVRIYKKATGQPSVTWDHCVVAAICWGWIDGQRQAPGNTAEVHGGDAGEVGAGRESLRVVAAE